MKTREEVEECWGLAETEGFEEYRWER